MINIGLKEFCESLTSKIIVHKNKLIEFPSGLVMPIDEIKALRSIYANSSFGRADITITIIPYMNPDKEIETSFRIPKDIIDVYNIEGGFGDSSIREDNEKFIKPYLEKLKLHIVSIWLNKLEKNNA